MITSGQNRVIGAIADSKLQVTLADVVKTTGLSIGDAARALNSIAQDSGAVLRVSESGDVIYQFSPGFQFVYVSHGIWRVAFKFARNALRTIYRMFQITLLAAVILSCLLLSFALAMSPRGFLACPILWGWLLFLLYKELTTKAGYKRPSVNAFHYVFGDRDSNYHIEERKWLALVHAIDTNGNKLIVDQMAPFTGLNPDKEETALPVLTHFGGIPEVTESGNIVYLFPPLQNVAKSRDKLADLTVHIGRRLTYAPPTLEFLIDKFLKRRLADANDISIGIRQTKYLYECPASLSSVRSEDIEMFSILIVLACLGSSTLLLYPSVPLIGHTGALILCACMWLLWLFPTLRSILNSWFDLQRDARNNLRKQYADQLTHPKERLATKLKELEAFQLVDKDVLREKVIYTTARDVLEQEFEN